jgi:hypothetical protein
MTGSKDIRGLGLTPPGPEEVFTIGPGDHFNGPGFSVWNDGGQTLYLTAVKPPGSPPGDAKPDPGPVSGLADRVTALETRFADLLKLLDHLRFGGCKNAFHG